MDLYSFINSDAIANHLREIRYCFSSKEAAWLIYQCKKITLQEKHAAWEWLIENMPDCELEERMNCLHWDSLHDVIRQYINIENKYLDEFSKNEPNAAYQYRLFGSEDTEWQEYDHIKSSVDECWKGILSDYEENEFEIVEIKKTYIDTGKRVWATFDSHKNVLEIDTYLHTKEETDVMAESFDGFWFAFLVPFKVGDILIRKSRRYPGEGEVLVLSSMSTWDDQFVERMLDGNGDTTDMTALGYFQDEDGCVFEDVAFDYMDLDYYQGPFDGNKRLLVAISNFLKGEISLELVLTAYRKIILDEFSKDIRLNGWFTNEGMELAGLHDVVVQNEKKKRNEKQSRTIWL